ncbi:MAG: HlyD family efflux transporter periplasmic adaptor subunit, partial [Isosphaeraceae bacterium]
HEGIAQISCQSPGAKFVPNSIGVEPKGGLISITGVPGARIGEISVCEGQVVGANAKLFVLDNYRELDANCEMIEAQRDEAKTLLDLEAKNEALLREELDVEEAQIQQLDPYDRLAQGLKVEALRDAGENARIDSDRLIRLKEAGSSLVSQQEIDAQKLKVRSAKAELDEAEALLKKFDQAQKIARRKIEIQRRRAAIAAEKGRLAARIKSLEASHRAALIQRDQAVVHAVLAGRILRILSRPGETISAQPVLQMGDTSAMDVVAEVSELQARDLGRAGPVTMTALGETLHGTIDLEKSRRMVGRNSLFSLDPTVDADRRVILVRIRLDQRSSQMVADLTNLQVDVEIPLGPPRRIEPVGSAPADASTVNPPQPPS